MKIEFSLLISQIVAFLIVLWILKRFAWGPLEKILEERKSKIQAEFDSLEEQKKTLSDLTDSYTKKLAGIEQEAKTILTHAVEKGVKEAQEIREEARMEAKSTLEKVQADIKHEIVKAKTELKQKLVALIMQVSEKLIGEKMDSEKDKIKVREFVENEHF